MQDDTRRVLDEIYAERRAQVDKHAWSAAHDDKLFRGELARAAASYTLEATVRPVLRRLARRIWPFCDIWWRPRNSPRRNLVKAAALIVAEIERIDRTE